MANEFKVKKGLIVDGSNTVLDIQGTQGQLFSVTDSLTGDLFSVSDVSGIPIFNVNSSGMSTFDGDVTIDKDSARLILQDNSTGNALNQWISYKDSAGTERAYLGYGSTSNSTFYVVNHLSDLHFHANGAARFKVGADVHVLGGTDFAIAAGRKLYLDGQSNTYITEHSSDTIKIFTAGTEVLQLANNESRFSGDVIVPSGKISILGGNNLTISGTATDHAGLSFGTNIIYPATAAGTNDNTFDLGDPDERFKDLYLGGSITAGSAELSNYMQIKVDDAEIYWTNTANNDYWRWKRDANDNFICDHYNGTSTAAALTFNSSQNATFTGTVIAPYGRFTSTGDASVGGTGHAFQAGTTSSTNIIIDNNEIMARNNGATSTLNLNPDGNTVTFHSNGQNLSLITDSGNATFGGDVTVIGGDIRRGSAGFITVGDDSKVVSIGATNEMNFMTDVDSDQIMYLNHRGYNDSNTRFRSLEIRNGKGSRVAFFDGTNKNTTFAGLVNVNDTFKISPNGTATWGASNDYGQLSWDTGYVLFRGQSGKGIKLQVDSSTTALTLNTLKNATFAGNVGVGITPVATFQVRVADDVNFTTSNNSGELRLNAVNNAVSATVPLEFNATNYEFLGTGATTFGGNINMKHSKVIVLQRTDGAGVGQVYMDANDDLVIKNSGGSGHVRLEPHPTTGNVYAGSPLIGTSATFTGTVTGSIARFDTLNNNANSANIIYRSGTNTIVGNNASALVIEDNGEVGIGLTNPLALLHVRKDQAALTSAIIQNNTGSGASAKLEVSVGEPNSNDPTVSYNIGNGGFDWTTGVDNSDGDSFKISGGTDSHNVDLGTNTRLTIPADGGLDIQGTVGQLFSVTNSLTGDLFSVSDVSGVPILNVNSSGAITFDGYIPYGNKLNFGSTSSGLEIYSDSGSNSYIKETGGSGSLVFNSNSFYFQDNATTTLFRIVDGGGLQIFKTSDPYIQFYEGTTNRGDIFVDTSLNSMVLRGAAGHGVHLKSNGNTDASEEGIYLATNDRVGIGTKNPLSLLHIEGSNNNDGNDYAQLYIKGTGSYPLDIAGIVLDSAGSNQSHIRFHNNGTPKVQIRYNEGGNAVDRLTVYSFTLSANIAEFNNANGSFTVKNDIVAYGSPSDKRLKENIKPIESALDKVSKLQGVTFDWKEEGITNLKEDIGFIAQDVQKVIPELVRENESGMLSMRHQGIAPILLEAIKELKSEIEELKKQIK